MSSSRSPCCNVATCADQFTMLTLPGSTSRPTAAQLAALTALPSGMIKSGISGAGSRRGRAKKKGSLAKEGQVFAKFFDIAAGRPYPRNGIQMEQSITVELAQDFGPFFTTSITVPAYTSSAFSLANFTGYSSYVAVFDQYRIRQIEVWLEPITANASTYGLVATCIDLDDAGTPTTVTQVTDKQGALVGRGGAGHYHKWLPHVAVATYSGAFTSYGNVPACWIDSGSSAVQHYGLLVASGVAPSVIAYGLTVRAVVDFRAPCNN